MADAVVDRGMRIGGEEVPAISGATLDVLDPAHGTVIARVADGGVDDVDRAVAVAKETFDSGVWSQRPPADRARVMHRFADAIEDRLEELYRDETRNNGRPIAETRAQIGRLPEWYRYAASLLLAQRTAVVQMPGPYHSFTQRFPIGVVGILSSFNHPLMIGSKSLAPALATGNSVVLKPSEQTPLTTLQLGEIARRGRVPAGGPERHQRARGRSPGAALPSTRTSARSTFTGGTEPGRSVAVAAARKFAHATVELGGKSPVLVFADSPLA